MNGFWYGVVAGMFATGLLALFTASAISAYHDVHSADKESRT